MVEIKDAPEIPPFKHDGTSYCRVTMSACSTQEVSRPIEIVDGEILLFDRDFVRKTAAAKNIRWRHNL